MINFRASVSEAGDDKQEGTLKKYHVEKSFADRRYKVSSARTYFYLNEASCERNMDVFIRCLEAIAGELSAWFQLNLLQIILEFKTFMFSTFRSLIIRLTLLVFGFIGIIGCFSFNA